MVFFRDYVATFLNIPAIKGEIYNFQGSFWFSFHSQISVRFERMNSLNYNHNHSSETKYCYPNTALVVMVFMAYLVVAIWGCTKVKEGLERRKLSRYDSYSVEFYDMDDTYFRAFPYRIQVIITYDVVYCI